MTFHNLGDQKVKQNKFHAYEVLLNPSQKRKLKSWKTSFNTPLIWLETTLELILVVGSFYLSNFTKRNVKTEDLASGKVDTELRSVMIKPFVIM